MKVWKWNCESESVKVKVWKCEIGIIVDDGESVKVWNWYYCWWWYWPSLGALCQGGSTIAEWRVWGGQAVFVKQVVWRLGVIIPSLWGCGKGWWWFWFGWPHSFGFRRSFLPQVDYYGFDVMVRRMIFSRAENLRWTRIFFSLLIFMLMRLLLWWGLWRWQHEDNNMKTEEPCIRFH